MNAKCVFIVRHVQSVTEESPHVWRSISLQSVGRFCSSWCQKLEEVLT